MSEVKINQEDIIRTEEGLVFNPYNPLSYISIICIIVVMILLYGIIGTYKNATNPFNWN